MIRVPDKYRSLFSKMFMVLGFVSALSATTLYQFMWEGAYYHLIETSFVMYISVLVLMVSTTNRIKWTKNWKRFALFALLLSISTLIDELIYDATHLEWNDLIRFCLILIFTRNARMD